VTREGLAPAEAARTILADARPLGVDSSSLFEVLDRVLAEPVDSPVDIPPWDNSAMDGYAVRKADLETGSPVTLRVVGSVAAGQFPGRRPEPGECLRIFTGAPLPEGADGVIRQEDTTPLDGGMVRIDDVRDAGRNVRHRGEDIRRGSRVFEAGTVLGPAHIGVLASIARRRVPVHHRPLVACVASGDEIVELDQSEEILAGRKIASSNTYTLASLLAQNQADAINLGIARDDPADLRERLMRGETANVLLTTAGISVGEHDYVRTVLDELGLDLRFWRIRMRPGAPVGYGLMRNGTPWVGLPGNPVSTMVTFELFVRPLLRKLAGHRDLFRRTLPARVAERIVLGPRLQHFLRVTVSDTGGERTVRLTGAQGSGILTSMARADALLIVPEDRQEIEVGETLPIMRLDETVHVNQPPF
jgi:molybdopterin molybdotransferase